MVIKITTRGLDRFVGDMQPLRSGALLHDILDEGIHILKEGHERRFDQEVDSDGAHWAPLKESTRERKGSSAILKDTGRLRGGFREVGINQWARAVRNDVPYGSYHQTGTPHMVPRPFMGISADDDRNLESMITRRLRSL